MEIVAIAVPPGEGGERFRALVAGVLPEVEIEHAGSPDDILFYRERANLPLSDLEQLGGQAHDAYLQMNAAEHFTPHSRTDVDWTR